MKKQQVYAATIEDEKVIYMHDVIMNTPPGMRVRHIDGNGLNNVRANLLLVPEDDVDPRNAPAPEW